MNLRRCACVLAGVALVSTSACDKNRDVSKGDRRLSVGAGATNLCPNPQTLKAHTTVTATVFGPDGKVQPGVDVTFSSDLPMLGGLGDITLDATSKATDTTGRAIVNLTTNGRPPGDKLSILGRVSATLGDTVEINVPLSPFVQVVPDPRGVESGLPFEVAFILAQACNVNTFDIDLTFDASIVNVDTDPRSFSEGGILNANADGTSGVPLPTEHAVIVDNIGQGADHLGSVHVHYARIDSPRTGASVAGTYFRLVFKPLAKGAAKLKATRNTVHLYGPPGTPLAGEYVIPDDKRVAVTDIVVP